MKGLIKSVSHWHRAGGKPPVVLFASPRGGSTWVTELVASQPGFWPISEPLNVRSGWVRSELGLDTFSELYAECNAPQLQAYYAKLLRGGYSALKLRPGLKFYRPFTNRIVVKENQACLDRIDWFEDTFGVQIIHLIRHPIPVALSREVFPLLEQFDRCELRSQFSEEQLQFADDIIASGTHLQKGVLAWCLHHAPALLDHRPSRFLVSYEHCVLYPDQVVTNLAKFLGDAGFSEAMRQQCNKPSGVIRKSDSETQRLLGGDRKPGEIVSKWRRKVSEESEAKVLEILTLFGVPIYTCGQNLPSDWMGSSLDGSCVKFSNS